jgi:hypothetical protein
VDGCGCHTWNTVFHWLEVEGVAVLIACSWQGRVRHRHHTNRGWTIQRCFCHMQLAMEGVANE